MAEANLGLIGWVLSKFYPQMPIGEQADAWQDGFFGLCRAVQKFDPAKARFSTYATFWIRQSIERGRATEAGIGFRQSKASGEPWQRPLSLDATPSGDDGDQSPLSDWLEALDDPADEVAERVDNSSVVAAVRTCGGASDHDAAIFDAVASGRSDVALAADRGVSRHAVSQRRRVLFAQIRSTFDLATVDGARVLVPRSDDDHHDE